MSIKPPEHPIDLVGRANSTRTGQCDPLALGLADIRKLVESSRHQWYTAPRAAFVAGRALVANRRRCPTGGWASWTDVVLGSNARVAKACMRFYRTVEALGGRIPVGWADMSIWQIERSIVASRMATEAEDSNPDSVPQEAEALDAATLRYLSTDEQLMAVLRAPFEYVREAKDHRRATNILVHALTAYAQVL